MPKIRLVLPVSEVDSSTVIEAMLLIGSLKDYWEANGRNAEPYEGRSDELSFDAMFPDRAGAYVALKKMTVDLFIECRASCSEGEEGLLLRNPFNFATATFGPSDRYGRGLRVIGDEDADVEQLVALIRACHWNFDLKGGAGFSFGRDAVWVEPDGETEWLAADQWLRDKRDLSAAAAVAPLAPDPSP